MMSENKMMLLAKGIMNGGYIRIEEATQIYHNKNAATSAIQSLRAWGYVKKTKQIGVLRILKAPEPCFEMAKNLEKDK